MIKSLSVFLFSPLGTPIILIFLYSSLCSGGFFAKLNGICKMKDHSTRKVVEATHGSENSQVDFKPLKVPAVFKLLRPEFREQLKQSSCKIEIPQERDCFEIFQHYWK